MLKIADGDSVVSLMSPLDVPDGYLVVFHVAGDRLKSLYVGNLIPSSTAVVVLLSLNQNE